MGSCTTKIKLPLDKELEIKLNADTNVKLLELAILDLATTRSEYDSASKKRIDNIIKTYTPVVHESITKTLAYNGVERKYIIPENT